MVAVGGFLRVFERLWSPRVVRGFIRLGVVV